MITARELRTHYSPVMRSTRRSMTMAKNPTVKRVLTPEQHARLVQSMMRDADRRANPDPRQSQPVSDEDLRSFPGVDNAETGYGIPADRDGD